MSNPYGQIQPYQDRLAQLQNNYQQAMPYGQMQMQQPVQQMQQMPMLQGQMVDGIQYDPGDELPDIISESVSRMVAVCDYW